MSEDIFILIFVLLKFSEVPAPLSPFSKSCVRYCPDLWSSRLKYTYKTLLHIFTILLYAKSRPSFKYSYKLHNVNMLRRVELLRLKEILFEIGFIEEIKTTLGNKEVPKILFFTLYSPY